MLVCRFVLWLLDNNHRLCNVEHLLGVIRGVHPTLRVGNIVFRLPARYFAE